MASPQSLTAAQRRVVAAWAADCAEHVLALFLADAPTDDRPRALLERTRAFARGELSTAEEIRRRFTGGVGAGDVRAPAPAAAARAAGQAVAVCQTGAHALGAAAYAARAVGLADPGRPQAVHEEVQWQLDHTSVEVREALRALPPAGHDRAGPLGPGLLTTGPLGPGLLTTGPLGSIVQELQARAAGPAPDAPGTAAARAEGYPYEASLPASSSLGSLRER